MLKFGNLHIRLPQHESEVAVAFQVISETADPRSVGAFRLGDVREGELQRCGT